MSDVLAYGLDEGTRVRLLAELADVQLRIVEVEHRLAERLEELATFRLWCNDELGALLVQCAALRAELAELHAAARPTDEDAAEHAGQARRQATTAESEWHESAPDVPRPPADDDLKHLYREVARRLHPDLTTDPDERERRTDLMVAANAAYAARNAATLRHMLEIGVNDEPGGRQPSRDEELVAAVAAAWRRFDDIERAMAAIDADPMWQLRCDAEQLAARGRDLIGELRVWLEHDAANLHEQVDAGRGAK